MYEEEPSRCCCDKEVVKEVINFFQKWVNTVVGAYKGTVKGTLILS